MNRPQTSSPDWREWRRRRAWHLYKQGWKQKDIAEALGVSKGAVSQWITKAKQDGVQALHRQLHPGRNPRLSQEQLWQLPALLAKGAEAYGFQSALWTNERIAYIIKQQFGINYHPAHCGRLLRAINQKQWQE